MMNNLKISFVGPYSTANLGDYAMLVNNIYDFDCQDNLVFTYSNKFPKISLDMYCNNYNIIYMEPKLKNNIDFDVLNNNHQITPIEILSSFDNLGEIIHEIEKIDLMIVSGGGWINNFWAERKDKVFKIMLPLLIAQQLNKKIIFTANGIGPIDETKEFYLQFFRYIHTAKIAIRDNFTSMSYLKEIGVKEEQVTILPDDLYIINPSIISSKRNFFIKSKNYIVMEMYYPLSVLEKNIDKIKIFAKNIKEKYDLDIVFLPYDLVYYGLDQARYLHKNISNSEIIDIESIGFLPIQDAYHIIKNAKFMISSRYHGLVLSLSVETPVIYRILPVKEDLRYSYSKALGLLRSVFNDQLIYDSKFISLDLFSHLEEISNNLLDIIKYQKDIFSDLKYTSSKTNLKNLRKSYIESFCKDEINN